jgi:hypothetical protein
MQQQVNGEGELNRRVGETVTSPVVLPRELHWSSGQGPGATPGRSAEAYRRVIIFGPAPLWFFVCLCSAARSAGPNLASRDGNAWLAGDVAGQIWILERRVFYIPLPSP